jgi:predicted CopG family antitoxin
MSTKNKDKIMILIDRKVAEKLRNLGTMNDTYSDVINRLIETRGRKSKSVMT